MADTQADLVVVLARQRSYWGGLFHRSVTGQLLTHSPVPVLVLPVAVAGTAPTAPPSRRVASVAHWANTMLAGLAPAA
ncbi:universal stress protein [Hymenobacter sp. BRD128]|uniref:universal stress protein n=1 Tax=Hymenobacter sp. BRD128 TaxID=2675878 RepID=UPI00156438B0|nr:universal stress protein [Hymenobacter sp. BRD128]QKG55273.1 universal stress protein [Hymenobacter sp. BRD128]